jgi:hypothetical protein
MPIFRVFGAQRGRECHHQLLGVVAGYGEIGVLIADAVVASDSKTGPRS